jgi:hypothetical protein
MQYINLGTKTIFTLTYSGQLVIRMIDKGNTYHIKLSSSDTEALRTFLHPTQITPMHKQPCK